MSEWAEIDEFPGYNVSEYGNVFGPNHDAPLTQTLNQQGIPTVGLVRDHRQHRRSVPVLVANAFLPDPPRSDFITPIQLDGDRLNCCADNLLWRPRWFAIQYHRERRQDPFPNWRKPFELIETGEMFNHPQDCAVKYGLLEDGDFGIFIAMANKKGIFPTGFHFRS